MAIFAFGNTTDVLIRPLLQMKVIALRGALPTTGLDAWVEQIDAGVGHFWTD